jgi:hypothetical protein
MTCPDVHLTAHAIRRREQRLTLVTVVLIPKPFKARLHHLTGVARVCFSQQHASKD